MGLRAKGCRRAIKTGEILIVRMNPFDMSIHIVVIAKSFPADATDTWRLHLFLLNKFRFDLVNKRGGPVVSRCRGVVKKIIVHVWLNLIYSKTTSGNRSIANKSCC